jgi:hypothetical protein
MSNSDLRIRRSLRDVGERSYTHSDTIAEKARSMLWSRTEYVVRQVSSVVLGPFSIDMNEVAGGRVPMGD